MLLECFTLTMPKLDDNRETARSRSLLKDTFTLYTLKCFSPATLIGVYESARLPISNFISSILSGGVDSCFGNNNISIGKVERRARAFFVAAANSKYHATTRNPLARLIFLQKS